MKELNRFRQFINEEIYTTEFKNYKEGKADNYSCKSGR